MVVIAGDAVTVEPVEELSPVEGDQLYVAAPLAVSATDPPKQIVGALGETATPGNGLTVTVTVAVLVQPFDPVPVTV